jgi:hypothetical protein
MRLTDIITAIQLTRFNQLSAIPHESSNKTAEIHIHTLDAHFLRIMPNQALLLYCNSIIALYTCKFLKKGKKRKKEKCQHTKPCRVKTKPAIFRGKHTSFTFFNPN